MCAQYIILGACVVGAVIVSLCAAWGGAIVRQALKERAIVERGTRRLRAEITAAWIEVRDARRELARRLSVGPRPG